MGRRNVYSAPPRYYKCTATHGTPRGTHGGPRGVVQQIPKGGYNIQGGFDIFRSQISYSCSYGEVLGIGRSGESLGLHFKVEVSQSDYDSWESVSRDPHIAPYILTFLAG